MRKRIFRNTALLVVVAIILTFLTMGFVLYNRTYAQMQAHVESECEYVKASLDESGEEFLSRNLSRIADSRITLIDTDGTVLFDSAEDPEKMENHSGRPEVQEAMADGEGSEDRLSETLSEQTYYYALRLDNGMVIRVADTMDSVWRTLFSGIGIAVVLIVVLVILALIVVRVSTNRIIEPINHLDLEHPLENENSSYEEISPLLGRIHHQNQQIASQVQQLKQNQEEYLTITENMKDGLIVTNRNVVLAINRSAQKLFDVTVEECVNHDIVTVSRNEVLKDALQEALKGNSNEKLLEMGGRIYQLMANPVRVSDEIFGAVILVLDVTEKQEAEKMRREFSANVSHELKTPLMSISGYAEIMENGMVRPEDIQNFAGRIHAEASRLSELVEDIIRLSRLDEAEADELPWEETDLYELCQDVVNRLAMSAAEHHVKLGFSGNHAEMVGVRQVLYEMIYNVCDNAVKYNRPGGTAEVNLDVVNGNPRITVKDTGIGIAREDIDRIFERFYRVDKSHSSATGGTGLGLSIVKHGAILHNAKVDVESEPGKGTTVTLQF
jgi:two-component system phosphate regulon sensor histidine kinase PhoR